MSRSIRIGRLAGIPIGLQPLWLVIVALITWSLGHYYYPGQVSGISPVAAYGLGLGSALLLFASILLHELGHALVARSRGIEIEEIDLWLLGGVARMSGSPKTAADELRFAAAGPAVTLSIAVVFSLIAAALPDWSGAGLRALVEYQAFVNFAILVFNLVPAFPLDGGRIARALFWMHSGDIDGATHTAAVLGRALGFAMIALGLFGAVLELADGLWLALVGGFVVIAAKSEERQQRLHTAFSGREAGRLMTFPAQAIEGQTTVADAVSGYFAPYRHAAFPVLEDGRPVGVLTTTDVDRVPSSERPAVRVGAIANRDPGLIVDEHQDVAELLDSPAFQRVGRAAVVTADGRLGMISITDVRRVQQALELGGFLPRTGAA